MAIYHFSAKIISRANGSSALAAAAYRSASRLHDQRLDRHHDFSNKAGVVHSEVMLPENAPEVWRDREQLWNAVEAAELRKDAQLAREVEFALPHELDQTEGIRLAREFVGKEFVARGMIADLNVHWDVGADGEPKPHAHVMLTSRDVDEGGFGKKNRDWNRTDLLERWREAWAEHVNARLAELDVDARVDHRSLEAQGIDLEPQHKIGPAAARMAGQGLASGRVEDHLAIARANGEKLLARPEVALEAITQSQATFTVRDVARFVHRHSDGKEQFDRIWAAVRASPELVRLGHDGRGEQRLTSRDMLRTEQRLETAAVRLDAHRRHGVAAQTQEVALARSSARGLLLSSEQKAAFEHVTGAHGLSIVVGYAGTGKSAMLGVARDAWEQAGYRVQGAALSGIAAENLEAGSGIASRTLASLEHQWERGEKLLGFRDVLIIDEAGMIGTRQLERIISEVERRGAKVVLVGDPEQLQAIEAGAAFRSLHERHGGVEIMEVRRQQEGWQRDATRHLATGRTGEAIEAYDQAGHVHSADTRDAARAALIERWDSERQASPDDSRIILAHTNDEVRVLNLAARERLKQAGEIGEDVAVTTERGERQFATGDRIMFLKNDRGLGVKNGSLGHIESVSQVRMAVMLDDGRQVGFDLKDYAAVDHGHAATIHKAQGMTVDRVHVFVTPGFDRHAAYVALSRHRSSVELHYGRDDFAEREQLVRTLSRDRSKDMASDYAREFADRREIRLQQVAPVRSNIEIRTPRQRAAEPSIELGSAVARHGRIVSSIQYSNRVGQPHTPEQRSELAASRAALRAMHPDHPRDLESAFANEPRLIHEAAEGRTSAAIRAMRLEVEIRVDPQRRADTFVQRWQALDRQRRLLLRDHEETAASRIATRMTGMAKGLERDPQLESILRNRKAQLGLPATSKGGVGQSLADLLGRGRSRGIGIGM
jgi:Ti-type conjugative transfer relaxase TraA